MDFQELNTAFLLVGQYVLYGILSKLILHNIHCVCSSLHLLTEESSHSRTLTLTMRFLLNVV